MLVKNWMSKNVITLDVNDSLPTAAKLQRQYSIRALPVLEKNILVGIAISGDIKRASASDATSLDIHELLYLTGKILVKEIMTKELVTALPIMGIVEVAQILLKHKINSVPINDRRTLQLFPTVMGSTVQMMISRN